MAENKQKKFKADMDANWKKFQEKWEINRIKTAEDWDKGWKKVQEDWDTGLKKLQTDWEQGLDNVSTKSKQIFSLKKQEKPPSPKQSETSTQDPSNKEFQQAITDFKTNVDSTLRQWQDQWNLQMKQWQENNKQNSEKFKQNIENSSKKMQQFLDQTNQQMKNNIQKLENDYKSRDKVKRDKFYSDFRKMYSNWNHFTIERQKKFEKNMMAFNKKAIKTEMKIILYALPFIFIILLFLMIFKNFF